MKELKKIGRMGSLMSANNAYILDYDIISAYGIGLDVLWQGVKDDKSSIRPFKRFDTSRYKCPNAAFVEEEILSDGDSHLMRMLSALLKNIKFDSGSRLIFASTVGEIDILESAILTGSEECLKKSTLVSTANKLKEQFGLTKEPMVVSAACASASSAITRALSLIRSGQEDIVVVVAADIISDFVYSGFTSLLALDNETARPFDESRAGLSVGEAAGYVVLASEKYLKVNCKTAEFLISGAGQSNDANHMTGPSRDGSGLALAINRALISAKLQPGAIDAIAAHGTGTKYNDSMELKAFKNVFDMPKVSFSVKGATGHTMGNAGLVQLLVSIKSIENSLIPKTVGLLKVDPEAESWVYNKSLEQTVDKVLIVNAGFGGINAALILEKAC